MTTCPICGVDVSPAARTCIMCGSELAPPVLSPVPTATRVEPPKTSISATRRSEPLPANARVCPACGKVYGPEYNDSFCDCGMELFRADQVGPVAAPAEPELPIAAVEEAIVEEAAVALEAVVEEAPPPSAHLERPPPGTTCLVLYGPDKQPRGYFPLEKDAVLIGRLDAVEGCFPDIDLAGWLEPAQARKVSRRHALILRSRATGGFSLRPLAGNTGTQIDADMAIPLSDYSLTPGQRMILGGVARFKFEIM